MIHYFWIGTEGPFSFDDSLDVTGDQGHLANQGLWAPAPLQVASETNSNPSWWPTQPGHFVHKAYIDSRASAVLASLTDYWTKTEHVWKLNAGTPNYHSYVTLSDYTQLLCRPVATDKSTGMIHASLIPAGAGGGASYFYELNDALDYTILDPSNYDGYLVQIVDTEVEPHLIYTEPKAAVSAVDLVAAGPLILEVNSGDVSSVTDAVMGDGTHSITIKLDPSGSIGDVITTLAGPTVGWAAPAETGAETFLELTDTPATYTDAAGQIPVVNSGETALEFIDPGTWHEAELLGEGIVHVEGAAGDYPPLWGSSANDVTVSLLPGDVNTMLVSSGDPVAISWTPISSIVVEPTHTGVIAGSTFIDVSNVAGTLWGSSNVTISLIPSTNGLTHVLYSSGNPAAVAWGALPLAGLAAGSSGQTLRYVSSWEATSVLTSTDAAVYVTSANTGNTFYVDRANDITYMQGKNSYATLSGTELVTNGTFVSDISGWTDADGHWSWDASGKAKHTAGTGHTGTLSQSITLTQYTYYSVTFTTSGRTAGGVAISIAGQKLLRGTTFDNYNGNTTYTAAFYYSSATGSQSIVFTPDATWDGMLDDISVQSVTSNSSIVRLRDSTGSNAVYISAYDTAGQLSIGNVAGTRQLSSASNNVFLGKYAGLANVRGSANTFVGVQAGQANLYGAQNTYIGYMSGYSTTQAYYNTGIGSTALVYNTTGYANTAVGRGAGYNISSGIANCVFGYSACSNIEGSAGSVTGSYNNAFGMYSLYRITTGSHNAGFGYSSLQQNTSGFGNIGIGYQSVFCNQVGQHNVGIGYQALRGDATNCNVYYNVAIGRGSLYPITCTTGTEGYANTAVGYYSGNQTTTGYGNIFLGYKAGEATTTGYHNIVIGYDIDTSSASASYELNIGGAIKGNLSAGVKSVEIVGALKTDSHIEIAQISEPSPYTDKLYNVGGTLKWNGSALSTSGGTLGGTISVNKVPYCSVANSTLADSYITHTSSPVGIAVQGSVNITGGASGNCYIEFDQQTGPAITTDRLYNVAGTLYWNGNPLSTASGEITGTGVQNDFALWNDTSTLTTSILKQPSTSLVQVKGGMQISGIDATTKSTWLIIDQDTAPDTKTNTLYNVSGGLYWNNIRLDIGSGIGDITTLPSGVLTVTDGGTGAVLADTEISIVGAAGEAIALLTSTPGTPSPTVTWETLDSLGIVTDITPSALTIAAGCDDILSLSGTPNTALLESVSIGLVSAGAGAYKFVGSANGTIGYYNVLDFLDIVKGSLTYVTESTNTLTFSKVTLTSAADVTGILPVANGGTNNATWSNNEVVYASSSTVFDGVPVNTSPTAIKGLTQINSGIPTWNSIVTSVSSGNAAITATTTTSTGAVSVSHWAKGPNTSKGSSTKSATITVNTYGHVTALSDTDIAFPVISVSETGTSPLTVSTVAGAVSIGFEAGAADTILHTLAATPTWSTRDVVLLGLDTATSGFVKHTAANTYTVDTSTGTIHPALSVTESQSYVSFTAGTQVLTFGAVNLTSDVTSTLPVASGGTAKTSWNQYGIVYASNATTLADTRNTAALLKALTMTGTGAAGGTPGWSSNDELLGLSSTGFVKRTAANTYTAANLTATDLPSGVVTPGVYGSSSVVPVITVDTYGRITAVVNTSIAGLNTSVLSSGTLAINRGGTGNNAYDTHGSIIYYDSVNTKLARLVPGASNYICTSGGLSSPPSWVASLTVGQGGTGQTSYSVGDMLYASGTTTLSKLAISSGQFLYSGATAPAWRTFDTCMGFSGSDLGFVKKTGVNTYIIDTSTGTIHPAVGSIVGETYISINTGTQVITASKVNLGSQVTGTLPVSRGGTGQTTLASGHLLVGNGTSGISTLSYGSFQSYWVVRVNPTGSAFEVGPVQLDSMGVTGTLPQSYGGTGFSTYTTGNILYASSTNVLSKLAKGTAYQVLRMKSDASNVEWGAVKLDSANAVTGNLPLGNGGTNASLSPSNGQVAYSTTTALALTTGGSNGQFLKRVEGGAPVWDSVTAEFYEPDSPYIEIVQSGSDYESSGWWCPGADAESVQSSGWIRDRNSGAMVHAGDEGQSISFMLSCPYTGIGTVLKEISVAVKWGDSSNRVSIALFGVSNTTVQASNAFASSGTFEDQAIGAFSTSGSISTKTFNSGSTPGLNTITFGTTEIGGAVMRRLWLEVTLYRGVPGSPNDDIAILYTIWRFEKITYT